MFNNQEFNSSPFNEIVKQDISLGIISYWDYLFDLPNFVIDPQWLSDMDSIFNVRMTKSPIASRDGATLNSYHLNNKTITIFGHIISTNRTDLEEHIDIVKRALLDNDKTLKYTRFDWKVLQTNANMTSMNFWTKQCNDNFVSLEVVFELLDWKFFEQTTKEWISSNVSSSKVASVDNIFWHKESLPKIFVTFNYAENCENLFFSIWDKEVFLNQVFSEWDIVQIDTKDVDVLYNWVGGLDWDWELPVLDIWVNQIEISLDWIFSVNLSIIRNPTYV